MPQIRKWLGVSTILREYPITKLIAVTNMFFCDEWPLASEWWCTEECVSRQGHVSLPPRSGPCLGWSSRTSA